MRGYCADCDRLLFANYGDGESLCAGCRENREERAQDTERAKAIDPPAGTWAPVMGRIGGFGFRETCLAHMQPDPCPACAAYKAAGL